MSRTRHLFEIHIAVLLFSLAGIFAKIIPLPAIIIVCGRVLFASITLFFFIIFSKQSLLLKQKKDYLSLFILGLLLAIHWFTFFKSIQLSTVAVGLITFSTFPIFTTLLEVVFFKEKLKIQDVLLACVVLIGIILIVPKFSFNNKVVQGASIGLMSGLTFAILSILNRKMVATYSSYIIAFYQNISASIVLIPFLFLQKFSLNTVSISLIIILGVVFTGISHSLFINGLKTVKAKSASIIAMLEPVYGIIIALFFLNEIPNNKTLIGGIIIIAAVVYETISLNNTKKNFKL